MNIKVKSESVAVSVDLRFIVPTLNRPKELLKTVGWIIDVLNDLEPDLVCGILISENHSDDELKVPIAEIEKLIGRSRNAVVQFIRQETRLSLSSHMRALSSTGGAQWHFWCGDDDLCDYSYIRSVIERIGADCDFIGGFVPSYENISQKDFFEAKLFVGGSIQESHLYKLGDRRDWFAAYRGHQLSGLVFSSSIEAAVNRDLPESNMYPWIAYTANCLLQGGVEYFRGCKTRITGGTPKLFSYGKDGLVPDIDEALKAGLIERPLSSLRISLSILNRPYGFKRINHAAMTRWGRVVALIGLFRAHKMRKLVCSVFFITALLRVVRGR